MVVDEGRLAAEEGKDAWYIGTKNRRQSIPPLAEWSPSMKLAIAQVIDLFANGLEVIQPQIHNGITNVGDLVHFL